MPENTDASVVLLAAHMPRARWSTPFHIDVTGGNFFPTETPASTGDYAAHSFLAMNARATGAHGPDPVAGGGE
jgi:hypothetical protein